MKHIVSWSGGKDSTATIILAHENGLPIDLIIISLVWFDRNRQIYGEYPEHIKWIFEYAIPLFESWGYNVEIVSSEKDYMREFYRTVEKSKVTDRVGKRCDFPLGGMCYMNHNKVRPIEKRLRQLAKGEDYKEYVGIAIDEPKRLERLHEKQGKISLLEKYGYTEIMAREKCEQYGLLSPIYNISYRGGCWFCPNQRILSLAYLKTNHPELWNELEQLSQVPNKVSDNFVYDESFAEIDKKVDEYILRQKTAPIQLTIFDMIGEFQ